MLKFDEAFVSGDSKENSFEISGYNGLVDPYLGPAQLTSVGPRELNGKNNLEFVITARDDEHNGQTHSHIIWEPEPDHPKFNLENFRRQLVNFVGHVLYVFSDKDTPEERKTWAAEQMVASNWSALIKQIVAALESVDYKNKSDWMVKIPGSTYKDPRLQIPPWPFSTDSRSTKTLQWSTKDLQENKAYYAALSKPKTDPSSITNAATVDDDVLLAIESIEDGDF